MTRLDLDIPGEQHLYLKAATPQERQGWLVALGSAKACVSSRSKKDNNESSSSNCKLFCRFNVISFTNLL